MEAVDVTNLKQKEIEPAFVDVVGHISLQSLEKADKKRNQKQQADHRQMGAQQKGQPTQQKRGQQRSNNPQQKFNPPNKSGQSQPKQQPPHQQRRPPSSNPNDSKKNQ